VRARLVLAVSAFALVAAAVGATATGAEAPTRDVTMPGKAYDPPHMTILTGTAVTWRNGDSGNHTVTADGDAFDSGYVAPGGSFSFTFAKEGHYAYHCIIHKFMKGTVDVFSLVLTGPEHAVGFGRQVVVAGLAPAGTTSVTLVAVGSKSPGKTVTARPDGSFTVLFRATTPGTFRAVTGKSSSPAVRVSVTPRVTVVRAGTSFRVSTEPARPGARVALQAYDRDHFTWRTIGQARLDARSHGQVALPKERPVRLRVVVRGEAGWADGATHEIVLR
jgi:plastocyanin